MDPKPRNKTIHERISELRKLFLVDNVTIHKHTASIDTLVDALVVLYDECSNSKLKKDKYIADFVENYRECISALRSLRINKNDFDIIKVIGRGAFGDVQVVRSKLTKEVYAMKTLKKAEMLAQEETAFFKEERDIMASADSRWITGLKYSFQDRDNLYLVMEYHQGGDLLTLLSKHDNVFEESMAKFYLAEIALAIQSLHDVGCVHRDIKPDNVLIDRLGHIKLVDFGSSARVDKNGMVRSRMAVGTPDYIAPEVLTSTDGNGVYGIECDWWSLGVVMYEMLMGNTPFYSESLVGVYGKIMNCKDELKFEEDDEISSEAQSLIKRLLCDRKSRANFQEIKTHPFFKGIDWDTMHITTPPYVPIIKSNDDTSNFEDFDEEDSERQVPGAGGPGAGNFSSRASGSSEGFSGQQLPFLGFTYTRPLIQSEEGVYSSERVHGRQSSSNASTSRSLPDHHLPSSASVASIASINLNSASAEQQQQQQQQQHQPHQQQQQSPADKELISNLESTIEALKDRTDTLEEMLTEQTQEIAMLVSTNEKLQLKLDTTNDKYIALSKAKSSVDQAVVELEKAKAVLELDIKSLEKERKAAHSESQNLDQMRSKHSEEVKELQARIQQEIDLREKAESKLAKIHEKIGQQLKHKKETTGGTTASNSPSLTTAAGSAATSVGAGATPSSLGPLPSPPPPTPASSQNTSSPPQTPVILLSSSSTGGELSQNTSTNNLLLDSGSESASSSPPNRRLEDLQNQLHRHEATIHELRELLEVEKERAKKSHKAKLELQKEKAVIELEVKNLKSQLDEAAKAKAGIEKELSGIRQSIDADRAEMMKMRSDLKEESNRGANLVKTVAALEQEKRDLGVILEEMRNSDLATELRKLQDSKTQQSAVIESLQAYIVKLEKGKGLANHKKPSSAALDENSDWKKARESKVREQELKQVQHELQQERTTKATLKEKIADLESRNAVLEGELEILKQEAHKWKHQYTEFVTDRMQQQQHAGALADHGKHSKGTSGNNKDDSKSSAHTHASANANIKSSASFKDQFKSFLPSRQSVAGGTSDVIRTQSGGNPLAAAAAQQSSAGASLSSSASNSPQTSRRESLSTASDFSSSVSSLSSLSASASVSSTSTSSSSSSGTGKQPVSQTHSMEKSSSNPSLSRKPSLATPAASSPAKDFDPTKRIGHSIPHRFSSHFVVKASKCSVCSKSVSLGKSVKCNDCHMIFHSKCADFASPTCGMSDDLLKQIAAASHAGNNSSPSVGGGNVSPNRNNTSSLSGPGPASPGGLSQQGGIDTVEAVTNKQMGWLKVPKPRGVRVGWMKKFVMVKNGRLLVFHADPTGTMLNSTTDLSATPEASNADEPILVIDSSVPGFHIQADINASELIHAASSDLPFIFKVGNSKDSLLMLAKSLAEKEAWVSVFEALVAESHSPSALGPSVVAVKPLYQSSSSSRVINMLSAHFYENRILVGAEEGLFACDDALSSFTASIPSDMRCLVDKPHVYQVEVSEFARAVVLIAENLLYLLPLDLMDYGTLMVKPVEDTQSCYMFATGIVNGKLYLCAAMQNEIALFEFSESSSMFKKTKFEAQTSIPCACLFFYNSRFIYGADIFYAVQVDATVSVPFLDQKDVSLAFLITGAKVANLMPLAFIPLANDILLCFNDFGVFVDKNGKRSRPGEIKWNVTALHISYLHPFLLISTPKGMQVRSLSEKTSESSVLQVLEMQNCRYLGKSNDRAFASGSTSKKFTELFNIESLESDS